MMRLNLASRYVDVQDGQLYAQLREGSGPALVFLHYWGGSRRTWMPVIERLDPRQPFVAYDQRGWGESVDVPGPYDMQQLADDAQGVIDALGYTDFVLVGHSMGGKVAQTLAARKPAGLAGAILVAPAPAAPAGLTAALQEMTSHAYDNEETVHQSIDMMLTNGGLSAVLRHQVVEDSLRAHDEARLAWPLHGLVEDVSRRPRRDRCACSRASGRPGQGRPARGADRSSAPADPHRHPDRARWHRSPVTPGSA
jgi:pimeloyl-ACP methyl ester carboxylesterase